MSGAFPSGDRGGRTEVNSFRLNRGACPFRGPGARTDEGIFMSIRCRLPQAAATGLAALVLLLAGPSGPARAALRTDGAPAPALRATLNRVDPLALPALSLDPRGTLGGFAAPAPGSAHDLAQIGGRRGGPEEAKPVEEARVSNRVSPGRAMLYSLLLPGLGQQYAGRVERARLSYVIEGAIWTSFAVFRLQSAAQKDRFIEYAQRVGSVNPSGKDDEYWRLIANYERSEGDAGSANEFVRRQARALYPDDRAAQQAYEQANGYFGDMAWDWQTSDNLVRYKQLRSRSIDSHDRGRYSIALALVHRVISVIDVARIARIENRAEESGQNRALEPRGQFGLALGGDVNATVPLITYRATF